MKILLFGNAKIKYMPYINFYIENIDIDKNEVHVIYWNRDLKLEKLNFSKNIILHEFKYFQNDQCPKFFKIDGYWKLRKYVVSLIIKEKFDFIIALDSLPGILIFDKLKKYYYNKFIFDYRDSSYEKLFFFKYIVQKLIDNSYTTFMSSDGFRKYFSNDSQRKIKTSHNLLVDSLNHREDKEKYEIKSEKIRIAFWGFIRDEKINIEIIKKISLDGRFELHYYGREQQTALNLKKYVVERNIKNIFFHGEYNPEDRYRFILQTDIIHNVYFDDNMMLAMGNKYYDGIIFKIPQICMENSFMGEKVVQAKVGLACNPYLDCFTDKVFDYYKNLDKDNFNKNCDLELKEILNEYNEGNQIIKKVLNS